MRNIKLSVIVFGTFICFILSGCGKNGSSKNQTTIDMLGYSLAYDGNQLEKVNINNDDPEEILELYQEVGEDSEFRDSLLIAEKYSRGMGVFAFAQDNLQALKDQELKIENIKRYSVSTEKNNDMLIVEYEITEGFIPEVPLLYVSQLFIPEDENIILMSFISENINYRNSASKMFRNIQ